jgi:hypothetical protein
MEVGGRAVNVLAVAQSELVDILARGYTQYRKWARRVPRVPVNEEVAMAEVPSDSGDVAPFSGSEKQLDWGPSPKHSWSQELTDGERDVDDDE